ncbi:LysR substrate-binding domain-containing protein [Klebsiella michiganensis]|uniref:LysR substrate-binding domain-containing protein n=1 Tax=Klebsiella michiganensis TaxID=1134687 RepID=UPI001D0EA8E0|nr:LysR substrate-binding domain-containing protein [Klebsiella michiganensis]
MVRVSASEIIGTEVLPPLFARIKEDYPQLTLELVISNRMQDLLNREADIAVRMSTPVQEQLIARRLAVLKLVCMPRRLIWHATVRRRVLTRCSPIRLWALINDALYFTGTETLSQLNRERFTVRTDSDVAQLNLIRAGAGIGMCQVQLAYFPVPLERVMLVSLLSSRHLAGYA